MGERIEQGLDNAFALDSTSGDKVEEGSSNESVADST
jgi:hypothetical protein